MKCLKVYGTMGMGGDTGQQVNRVGINGWL
jgi:hypothetical protein